ncbi:MAG: hypothetical protein WBX25_11805 [Rhodomicrobium sp.]
MTSPTLSRPLSLASQANKGRDAYLALAGQYESYAESLPEEAAQRTPEENRRLMELEQLVSDAFKPMMQACPAHIHKVHEAVREALDAEEASSA